jgi:hypothetical protein
VCHVEGRIQAHDVDTVTIQMAGLFQQTSQEEGEEISNMDQEGQETPEESNEEEEEEEEEEGNEDPENEMEATSEVPESIPDDRKMLRLLHGFETNFGNIASVLRKNSSHSPRKKPRLFGFYSC